MRTTRSGVKTSGDVGEQSFFCLGASLPGQPLQHRNTGNDDTTPAHLVDKGRNDVVFAASSGQCRSSTVDQQCAQITISSFADPEQTLATAT
ncbi:hypothetical protein [Sinorhizobium meliloti]